MCARLIASRPSTSRTFLRLYLCSVGRFGLSCDSFCGGDSGYSTVEWASDHPFRSILDLLLALGPENSGVSRRTVPGPRCLLPGPTKKANEISLRSDWTNYCIDKDQKTLLLSLQKRNRPESHVRACIVGLSSEDLLSMTSTTLLCSTLSKRLSNI